MYGIHLSEPIGTKGEVCNMMLAIRDSIIKILTNYKLEIIELFECGTNKIEFMVRCKNNIISISVVDDWSYDFMLFDKKGEKILYSNTKRLLSLNDLCKLLNIDLSEIITKYI